MAVTLLTLSDGHHSLEFEPTELPLVASVIRDQFGVPDVEWHTMSSRYRFGGCDFTFYSEWEDPCLISGSAEGDAILVALHAVLKDTP